MIPGLPETVFLCGEIYMRCRSEALLRAGGQQACAAIGTGSGQKSCRRQLRQTGQRKAQGRQPAGRKMVFWAFTTGALKAVRSLAQGVQSYIHNCDTYIAAPFR